MLYRLIQAAIERGADKKDMTNKLNVYLLADQITEKEYGELMAMLKEQPWEEPPEPDEREGEAK